MAPASCWRRFTWPLAALALLLVVATLLVRGLARPSIAANHAVMFGPYSPQRMAYLGFLVVVIMVLASALQRRRLRLGAATALIGAALALVALSALGGYLDAVLARDFTLIRLPPTEDTENGLAVAVSFVRVSLAFLGVLAAGLALVIVSGRARGESAGALLALSWRTYVAAALAALTAAGRLAARAPIVTAGMLLVVVLAANVAGIRYQGGDRSTFFLAGRTILDGGVPYRDIWDIKFPAIYYVSALLEWFERTASGVRLGHGIAAGVVETAFGALTALAFYRLSRQYLGRRWAAGSTLAYAVAANDPIVTAGGHLTESYVMLPAILASLHAARSLRNPRRRLDPILVGVWGAVASMVRPQALVPVVAFLAAAWLAFLWPRERQDLGRLLLSTASVLVGFVAPWAALLGYFAHAGALGEFLALPIGFNTFIARSFPPSMRLAGTAAYGNYLGTLLPLVLAAAGLVVQTALRRRPGRLWIAPRWAFLLLFVAGEFAGIIGIGRVSFHYMLETVPALWLLLGAGLARFRLARAPTPRWAVGVVGGVLLFQAAAGYVLYLARPWAALGRDYASLLPVIDFIRARTAPGDSIFVGVTSQSEAIYYYTDRRPASRYTYMENAVAAYTGGRYLQEIEASLARSRPRLLIVDATHRWYDAANRREQPLNEYIQANYDLVTRIDTPRITWLIYEPRGQPWLKSGKTEE